MSTRLAHVVIDANEPASLARFWADALGWSTVIEGPQEVELQGGDDDLNLIFVPVSEPKQAKSRVHLDLVTTSTEDQAAKVGSLIELGASRADIGQADTPWVVLGDPEGNEFCVLPQGYYEEGTGSVGAICFTPEDRGALLAFWAAATNWPRDRRGLHRGRGPHIVFGGGTPAPKTTKNRIHLDLAPEVGDDQQAEVARLMGAGARQVDIGQGDVPWTVMVDPEGNEFCILTPR